MASASADQVNVLLPSDEGSPSAPPARWLSMTALLAVPLCAAAGFAGAVVMWRLHFPPEPELKNPWAQDPDGPEEPWKHYTAKAPWKHYLETSDGCEDIKDEDYDDGHWVEDGDGDGHWESEQGRLHLAGEIGEFVNCKSKERTCTARYAIEGAGQLFVQKCFPAECEPGRATQSYAAAELPEILGLNVTCVDGRGWEKYLSQECHDDFEVLQEEAGPQCGRRCGMVRKITNFSYIRSLEKETEMPLDCNHSEQICTIDFWINETVSPRSKLPLAKGAPVGPVRMAGCFPAICEKDNIVKGMEKYHEEYKPDTYGFEGACVAA